MTWAFPHRLPLGAGFCGSCRAQAEEFVPGDEMLRDFCNLGHAEGCPRLPSDRRADSLRFAVAAFGEETVILHYAYDRAHAPLECGRLEYDRASRRWRALLDDACAQRQADCYLAVYLEKKSRSSDPSTIDQAVG